MTADTWTFVEVDSGNARASAWELGRNDTLRARFVALPQQERIVVTFRWIGKRTTEHGAKMYARAEACRFIAQMCDTVGDIECDVRLGGTDTLEVKITDSSTASECSVTLEGGDALYTAAVYFGDAFASAM